MKLQEITTDLFGQLTDISSQLTPDEYAQPLEMLFGASIGKHLRHVIECYALTAVGYRNGYINYDQRVRQIALENDPQFAIDTMKHLNGLLRQFTDDRTLRFEASYSADAVTDISITTTFYRELLYNIEHTVHHSAIIRIGLERTFPHISIPINFGVAYATQQHQKQALLTTA